MAFLFATLPRSTIDLTYVLVITLRSPTKQNFMRLPSTPNQKASARAAGRAPNVGSPGHPQLVSTGSLANFFIRV